MRLVSFFKSLVGCTDNASSRYALGGVCAERSGGTAYLTATDGAMLVNVEYEDEGGATEPVILEGKPSAKAFGTVCQKKRETVFEVVDGKALLVGGSGSATAPIVEGRFPAWRMCFEAIPTKSIKLDPERLGKLLAVYEAADVNGVDFWVEDDRVYLSARTATGETIRSILMQRAADDDRVKTEWPSFYFQTVAEEVAAAG